METRKKECDISGIENIKRGLMFEKDGIKYFETKSKSTTQICGFFYHPSNDRYGSSPDAIGPNGILVEIKTRAKNAIGPIQILDSCPHYYVRCQLQMACTDAHSCVLVSYHPETKSGNFFLVQRSNIIIDILMDVCNAILDKTVIDTWVYNVFSASRAPVFRTNITILPIKSSGFEDSLIVSLYSFMFLWELVKLYR